jgi:hypothetical protein
MNGKVISSFELVAVPEPEDMGLVSELELIPWTEGTWRWR